MSFVVVAKAHGGKGPRTKKQRVARLRRRQELETLERQRAAFERNKNRISKYDKED